MGPQLQLPLQRSFSALSAENLPQKVKDTEYAVRGAVLLRAEQLAQQLAAPSADPKARLPFDKTVPCNIGNPQAVGQLPIQFHRQVLACLADPSLIGREGVFASDVYERAAKYLDGIHDGAVGAYSHSKGHKVFRDEVAGWMEERDGFPADPEDIYLTNGASVAVKLALQLMVRGPMDGVMLPIPQYPLYSASMTLLGGQFVGYYLDEEKGWSINLAELERAAADFRKKGGNLRAIAVINPGNPTGGILSREAIEEVLRFAEREKLSVLADEVYQANVYADGKNFVSFRRVAHELNIQTEVFSFHSTSKGLLGECGMRGGLVHCYSVDSAVKEQIYKLASISLCSNILGQALMASSLVPPPVGGPSRNLFDKQQVETLEALRRKAKRVTERLNAIEGISCQPIEGAMYAFPRVVIKGYIMKKAISLATPADQIYCLELVERTGVITVPGSGFGQRPGTFHFRMTILPDEQTLEKVLDDIEKFHNEHAGGWFA